MIRMLIIDDEYYIRRGIVHAFDWASMGIEIIGEAADGEEGFLIAMREKPDLILMDICMPFLNGLELMEKLRDEKVVCEIIVLSGYDEFEYAQKSIQYGVLDYLLKPIDKMKLKDTVSKACVTLRNKRSLENYKNIAQKEELAIKNQFIRDLLLGNVSDEKLINEKIERLHLPLMNGRFQLICVKLDDYELLENTIELEKIHKLKKALLNLLESYFLLGKNYMGMVTSTSNDEWGIVISYAENTESQEIYVSQAIEDFLTEAKKASEYTLSLSISSVVNSVEQLEQMYKNVRRNNKKFIPRRNSVVWSGKMMETSMRPEILSVLNFVKNHYNEPVTIQQVADSLYISPSYLMHLFKSEVGKTFNTFLFEYRMEKAKDFLKKPGIQIQMVSELVGYSDVKYFCKLFKKYTQLTPSDYVRTYYAKHQKSI